MARSRTDDPAPITYLIDPLCGWCYAAVPQMERLRQVLGATLVDVLPTGLFSGAGARPMTAAFRDYAWKNDQRIAELTGQPFSRAYYDHVLSDFSVPFDSGPASLTLAMGDHLKPGSGLEILRRLQQARFVEGRNLCDSDVLLGIVAELGFDRRGFAAALDDAEQSEAAMDLITAGRRRLARHGLEGVPALILHGGQKEDGQEETVVSPSALVDRPERLVEKLIARFGAVPH